MKINLKKSFYPSLCYHGLKKLGFTSENPEDKYLEKSKRLSKMGEDFSFSAPVAGGPLFTFIYQIPGYLEPEDPGEFQGIMNDVKRVIKNKDISLLTKSWPDKTKYWGRWYTECLHNYMFKGLRGNEETVNEIIGEFTEFIIDIWDGYEKIYDGKFQNYPFEELQINVDNLEVEKIWKNDFDWEYSYDRFELIICPESRTAASSLGPEKVVFSSKYPWEAMKNSIIHEVGVRFFDFQKLCQDERTHDYMYEDYVGMLRLIETEICYRKKRIMPNIKEDPFATGMKLEKLIEWRGRRDFGEDIIQTMNDFYEKAKENDLL